MTMRSSLLVLGLCLAALAPGARAEGDPARGEKLAYTCHGCHGIPDYKNAYPNYRVPKLGGQHAPYLIVALKAYAAGERPHPTMHAQAATMTEQDMADMAAYLESEPVTAQGAPQGTPPEASATCVACHGNEGVGILPEYPTLSGQYADYIEHALKEYRAGRRQNAIMAGFAAGLEDADIEALAAFFSAQTPGLCSTLDIRKHGKCQH